MVAVEQQLAVVQLGHLLDDGQPQPAAGLQMAFTTDEGFNHPLPLLRGDAGALIADFGLDPAAITAHRDSDQLAGAAVAHGVIQQIAQGQLQQGAVAADSSRLGQLGGDGGGRQLLLLLHHLTGQFGQLHRLPVTGGGHRLQP